jgi:predicted RNase H-like nuclease
VTRALGVDACPVGWVGIELVDGGFAAAHAAGSLEELLTRAPAEVVAVDMPLGLVDRGWRTADRAAADLLGALRSSVFAVAPRAVWAEADHAAASRRCRELAGGGLSIQAWGLRAKLHEANLLWDGGAVRMYEVHPELSFRAMAGTPLRHRKTTWAGQMRRRALLEGAGIVLPEDLGEAGAVPPIDVLDAAAAAWSACRLAAGSARSLPDPPQANEGGQQIAIWY